MPSIAASRPRTVTSSNVDNSPAGDTPPSDSNPAAPPPPPADTFESSATTRQLKKTERALTLAGHDSGNVDGDFNDKTRAALRSFQKGTGPPVTGELDERTFNKLPNLSDKLQEPGGKKTFRPGMKSVAIKDVEKNLRRLGYAPGPADGLFTPATASAVTELKKDQGNKNRSGTRSPATAFATRAAAPSSSPAAGTIVVPGRRSGSPSSASRRWPRASPSAFAPPAGSGSHTASARSPIRDASTTSPFASMAARMDCSIAAPTTRARARCCELLA